MMFQVLFIARFEAVHTVPSCVVAAACLKRTSCDLRADLGDRASLQGQIFTVARGAVAQKQGQGAGRVNGGLAAILAADVAW